MVTLMLRRARTAAAERRRIAAVETVPHVEQPSASGDDTDPDFQPPVVHSNSGDGQSVGDHV